MIIQPSLFQGVPPSGGSLEIGNCCWVNPVNLGSTLVPPSGGSLEIGNDTDNGESASSTVVHVPPSGGSLEIGNMSICSDEEFVDYVPPSGGSLEIGNHLGFRPHIQQ